MKKIKTLLDLQKKRVFPALRKVSKWWEPANECLAAAKIGKDLYRCAECKEGFPRSQVNRDHKHPVVDPNTGFVDWNTYISRMFCDVTGYQILCVGCHNKKSQSENTIRRERRKAK